MRFLKAVRTTNLLAKPAAAKASGFSKARGFKLRIRWFGKRAQTKGLLRQETGLWPEHRAVWDWKRALGLAEEKRDYEMEGGRINFPHTVSLFQNPRKLVFRTCYLSSVSLISMPIKCGLNNICLSRKGNWPIKVHIDLTYSSEDAWPEDWWFSFKIQSNSIQEFIYTPTQSCSISWSLAICQVHVARKLKQYNFYARSSKSSWPKLWRFEVKETVFSKYSPLGSHIHEPPPPPSKQVFTLLFSERKLLILIFTDLLSDPKCLF